jgi:hypothetical protein
MDSSIASLLGSIAPVAGAPMLGFLEDASGYPRQVRLSTIVHAGHVGWE